MARCFLPRIRPRHTLCSKLTLKKVPLGRAGEVDSTAIQVATGGAKLRLLSSISGPPTLRRHMRIRCCTGKKEEKDTAE